MARNRSIRTSTGSKIIINIYHEDLYKYNHIKKTITSKSAFSWRVFTVEDEDKVNTHLPG